MEEEDSFLDGSQDLLAEESHQDSQGLESEASEKQIGGGSSSQQLDGSNR